MRAPRRLELALPAALALTLAAALSLRAAPTAPAPPPVPAPVPDSPSPPLPASAPPPVPVPDSASSPLPEAAEPGTPLAGARGAESASPPPPPRADAALDRAAHSVFPGGYLTLTRDFASADGTYDLIVHFHGNTELVAQSLAHLHLNAVFVPLNYGVGSAVYQSRFADPRAFPELLARVQAAMEKRGLARAHLGRVALLAWSAGYGAVHRILERPEHAEQVDAVLLLDCLHLGLRPDKRGPDLSQLAPWERYGVAAVQGRKLLTITHSDIEPDAYVGAHGTTDLLLRRLGLLRYAAGEVARIPDLPAVEGTAPKRHRTPLSPLTLADRGQLRVRGYAGDQPEHHIQHLMQMASIALPDLAAWWSRPREGSP